MEIYRHLWGVTTPIQEFLEDTFLKCIPKLFSGIEAGPVWMNPADKKTIKNFLHEYKTTSFIGMVFTDLPNNPQSSVMLHIEELKRQVDLCLAFSPKIINVHGGKDYWTEREVSLFLDAAFTLEDKIKCPLAFETHRGRFTYSPWSTIPYLKKYDNLNLTADLSHWITVMERPFEDFHLQDILELIAARTLHIHARIGYDQSPQIPFALTPYFEQYKNTFNDYFSKIVIYRRKNKQTLPSFTPEYGPFPYHLGEESDLNKQINTAARELLNLFKM